MSGDGERQVLRTVNLTKAFAGDGVAVTAVRGADLVLEHGEFAAITGPSGAGKSTLLHMLGGLERPTSGEIWLNGQRVDQLSQARWAVLRRRHIGFVFQFFNLVSNMTVADNVELAAIMGGADFEASLDELLDNQRRGFAVVLNAEDLFARFRHAAAPLRQRTWILG